MRKLIQRALRETFALCQHKLVRGIDKADYSPTRRFCIAVTERFGRVNRPRRGVLIRVFGAVVFP